MRRFALPALLAALFITPLASAQDQLSTFASIIDHAISWQVKTTPTSEVFRVSAQKSELNIEVFDTEGSGRKPALLRHHKNGAVNYTTGVDLHHGLYLVKVTDGKESRTYKLLKLQK